jgi:hypothetical protein
MRNLIDAASTVVIATLLAAPAAHAAGPPKKALTVTYDEKARTLQVDPPALQADDASDYYGVAAGLADVKRLQIDGAPAVEAPCAGGEKGDAKHLLRCFAITRPAASKSFRFGVVDPAGKPVQGAQNTPLLASFGFTLPAPPPPPPRTLPLPGIALELGRATFAPDALGKDLSDALVPAGQPVDPLVAGASLKSYCEPTVKPPAALDDDCNSAAVKIRPDGGISYNRDGTLGAFCLMRDDAWGARQIVRVRELTQGARAAVCVEAKPGTTYVGPAGSKEHPTGRIEIWAERAAEDLKAQRDDSIKRAREMLGRYLRAAALRLWSLQPATVYQPMEDAGRRLLDPGAGQAEIDRFVAARRAVIEAINALFSRDRIEVTRPPEIAADVWLAEIGNGADMIRKALPEPPWTVGLRGGAYEDYLTGTRRRVERLRDDETPKLPDAARVVRAVALAHQDKGRAGLPWPFYAGDVPISDAVKVFPLKGGKGIELDDDRSYEDTRALLFAHDVDAGGTAAIVETDEKVTRDPGDIARLLAGILTFYTGGGAVTVSPTGGPSDKDDLEGACARIAAGESCASKQPGVCASVVSHLEDWRQACRARKPAETDSPLRALLAVQRIRHDLPEKPPIEAELTALLTRKDGVLDAFLDGSLESTSGAPSAKKTSVVRLATLKGGIAYLLLACTDAKDCSARTDAAKITAQRKIKVYTHPSYFGVALEFGASAPIGKSNLPIGGYGYAKVESATSPQQLYQLRSFDRVSDHLTFSTLFVVYPFAHLEKEPIERLGLALGPTLWRGGSGEFGKQWNARLVWGPPKVPGLLLQTGLSLEWVSAPAQVPVGSYVSVPQGSAAPDFRADNHPLLLFSAGVALDLTILGTVTNDLIGKIRGSGKDDKP